MFLKRGLAAALAAVTVIGLAGCGGSDDAAEADTATVKKGFVEKKVEPVNFDSGVELTSDCYHFIYALGYHRRGKILQNASGAGIQRHT